MGYTIRLINLEQDLIHGEPSVLPGHLSVFGAVLDKAIVVRQDCASRDANDADLGAQSWTHPHGRLRGRLVTTKRIDKSQYELPYPETIDQWSHRFFHLAWWSVSSSIALLVSDGGEQGGDVAEQLVRQLDHVVITCRSSQLVHPTHIF